MNDFRVQLNATFKESDLLQKLNTFFNTNTFTVKLDVDTSKVQTALSQVKGTSEGNKKKVKDNTPQAISVTSDADLANLDQINNTLNEQGQLVKQVTTQYDGLNHKIVTTWKAAKDGTAKAQKAVETYNLGVKENLKLAQQNEKNIYKLESSIKAYASQTKLSKKETAFFTDELQKIKASGLDEIEKSKAIEKLNTDVREAANSVGILGQSFGKAFIKYTTWLAIATIVAQVIRGFKNMFSQVKALDDAMVELNKVFDGTQEELNAVKSRAFEVAKAVARTGEDVIKATTEFKRMGYTIDESLKLAKIANMMTNVAEGITDTSEAANILVSVLKGLGISSEYAMSLLDRLNEVSNKNAVSFDNLATMVQESAATMNLLGNTLDETIGLLVGGYEVLQDNKVAKGIQTIGLRISGLNEDLEEQAGLSNEVAKALKKYADISIWDEQTGALKNTYAILGEVAAKWDEIGQHAGYQEALLNKLAGKQRADVAAAIISNWNAVAKASGDAANSMGSAAKENEAAIDSIQGHINSLKSAWQQLSDSIISSDFVKGLVDIGHTFVNIIQTIVNVITALGGLKTVLLAVAAAVLFLNAQAIAGLVTSVVKFTVTLIPNLIKSLITLITTTWSAVTAQAALQSVLTFGIGAVGIVAGIAAVVVAIQSLTSGTNDAAKAAESASDEYKDLAETFEDSSKAISEYNQQLTKLKNNLHDVKSEMSDQIDLLNKQQEKLKKERDLQDKILAVEKAREALAAAKKNRIRVYRAGQGFVYEEDAEKVQEAQESLTSALNELADYKFDYAISRAKDFIEQFNELLTSEDMTEGWADLFNEFNDLLDTEFASYINKAKNFIDDFNKTIGNSGAKISISSEVPHNAKGTRNFKGGTTWVGENGPELVSLPQGSEILSNSRSMRLHDLVNNATLRNGAQASNLIFNGDLNFPNVRDAGDAEGFIKAIMQIGNNGIVRLT